MKYKYTAKEGRNFNKHGVDLTVYGADSPSGGVVHVVVKTGHFQEFSDTVSTFIYYIISGHGTFVLNDEKVEAGPTDLIVIPPNTRIHYFGTMDMVLTTAPAWAEEHERHVRFVDKSESPYKKG